MIFCSCFSPRVIPSRIMASAADRGKRQSAANHGGERQRARAGAGGYILLLKSRPPVQRSSTKILDPNNRWDSINNINNLKKSNRYAIVHFAIEELTPKMSPNL